MFLVEMNLRLGSTGGRLGDDDVLDLIEKIVDELDHLPVEPAVDTQRVGDDLDMTIGVVVDNDDEFEALRDGAAIISAGLHSSLGEGAAAMVMRSFEGRQRSSTRVLELV